MRILQRYIWRELALSFVAVTGTLLVILFVYQFGAVLARAAEQQYPGTVVMRLLAYAFVQNTTLLLPFGVLLAVVLAFGRLYQDNEMVAAQACGLGRGRLFATVAFLAMPVALLAAWLSWQVAPLAAQRESTLRAEALRTAMAVPIAAGQFRSISGGRVVVYARAVSPDGELQDVFIKRGLGERVETIVARTARSVLSADGMTQTITLRDGERIEGVPGSLRQRSMRFGEQTLPIVLPAGGNANRRVSELPSASLLAGTDRAWQAEWQLRISWALMTLMLAACAFSLARLRPRQGRFARVWVAVVMFAFYAAVLEVAVIWIQKGTTSPRLGTWWVHGSFAVLALLLALPRWPRRQAPRLAVPGT